MAATLEVRLATHEGAQTVAVDSWQTTSVGHIFAAGECTGIGGMELSAAEGRIAASAALNQPGQARALFRTREPYRRFAPRMHAAFNPTPALRALANPATISCICVDVVHAAVSPPHSWVVAT